MKNCILLLSLVAWTSLLQAQVDVTFRVDMSGVSVSPDGVHVAGDLNGWSPNGTQLTNQGGGIYMATVSLDPGRDIQYKYLNGNAWGTEEAAPATCTVGGNNRIFTVPAASDTLDLVPFNGCPNPVATKRVVFRVDMGNETPSSDGVHVAGNFVGWNPGVAMMTDLGDGIYEYQADVLASILTVQYKYVNGNAWGNEESIPEACRNGETNRFSPLAGDTIMLPTYVFGSCDTVARVTNSIQRLSRDMYRLMPDPASRSLTLALAPGLGQTDVRILDLQGRQVAARRMEAGQAVLHLTGMNWPSGIYVLQAQSSRGLIVDRFTWNQ